jgi:hypothetical protein
MALRDPHERPQPTGAERPRLAPPVPLVHDMERLRDTATGMGLTFMPWQECAAKYITAQGPDKRKLFGEVAVVVARQNGKTTLVMPLIIQALRDGKKVMHIANTRELPRRMFDMLEREIAKTPELMPRRPDRNGRPGSIIWPRRGQGQEEIVLNTGGEYRIAAANRGGARGFPIDILIVDELREMHDSDFIQAARPTMTASDDPQLIYLSNAGTDASVVLNHVRDRAADDPRLAYLEWSSAPERKPDDRAGWLEANPAIGHVPGVWDFLEDSFRSYQLSGEMGIFETEHLCRWVHTILPSIIKGETWEELRGDVEPPRRPALGVSLDPNGQRASAVLSWQQDDGRVAVRCIADVTGDPVDVPRFGTELAALAKEYKVREIRYDGATDLALASYFKKPDSVNGAKFTNASSEFVNLAEGHTIVWSDDELTERIAADIEWTGRKTHEAPGTWTAVKLSDEHPVTAMLATIRAVFLGSGPRQVKPRVH